MDREAFATRMKKAMGPRTAVSLSKETAIQEAVLSRYLHAKAAPFAKNLIAIANALGVRAQWLTSGEEPMREPSDAEKEASERLGHRIREAMERAGGMPAVAVKLRQSAPTLRSWSLGKARPTNEHLVELAKLARVRPHWLCTGQHAKEIIYDPITGFGNELSDEALSEYRVARAEMRILFAPDDSMAPAINTRERIIIDESNAPYESGSIYALEIERRLFIRRLISTRKGDKFVPDNSGAETFERPPDDPPRFIGRVVAVIKKV